MADICFWARMIDKIRLHEKGELPDDYAAVLGHKLGTDGQFLRHFGLDFDQVTSAVAAHSDDELSAWISATVDDFSEKREICNRLAPELGKEGTAMHRAFKFAIKRYFKKTPPPEGVDTIFGLIEFDENRA